jgi:hypothetical protein
MKLTSGIIWFSLEYFNKLVFIIQPRVSFFDSELFRYLYISDTAFLLFFHIWNGKRTIFSRF